MELKNSVNYLLYILSKYKGFGFGKMLVNKSKKDLRKWDIIKC